MKNSFTKNLFYFIKTSILDVFEYQLFDISAQTAFFFVLSFFPLILFILTFILSIPFDSTNFLLSVQDKIPNYLNPILSTPIKINPYLISISFLMLMWSSSTIIYVVNKNINKIYHSHTLRNNVIQRLWSLLINILFISLILLVMITSSIFNYLSKELVELLPLSFSNINVIINSILFPAFIFIFFLIIYYFSIPRPKKIQNFLLGSLVSTILIFIAFFIFNIVLITLNLFSSYGIVSTLIILLLYFYITSFIIFLGAIINKNFNMWGKYEQ